MTACQGSGCVGIKSLFVLLLADKTVTFRLHVAMVSFGREIHLTALTWKSTK